MEEKLTDELKNKYLGFLTELINDFDRSDIDCIVDNCDIKPEDEDQIDELLNLPLVVSEAKYNTPHLASEIPPDSDISHYRSIDVLVLGLDKCWEIGFFDHRINRWTDDSDFPQKAKYWWYLPAQPKEEVK